ncbi:MAG: hypothetical protein JO297_03890 [Nitrososphaeraceae archaeon]|nr:hypothetical protein [Nitrososphaeraceae archaeon]
MVTTNLLVPHQALYLRIQDDVLLERKRYDFDYLLSLLSIRKNLMDM